jgi:hypothetical protein
MAHRSNDLLLTLGLIVPSSGRDIRDHARLSPRLESGSFELFLLARVKIDLRQTLFALFCAQRGRSQRPFTLFSRPLHERGHFS